MVWRASTVRWVSSTSTTPARKDDEPRQELGRSLATRGTNDAHDEIAILLGREVE
jgi:hypothetical protein